MLYKGTRRVKSIKVNGRNARMILKGGRQVWPCRKAYPLPQLEYRITNDAGEKWFEVAMTSPELLEGSAATGWQDVRGYVNLQLQQSETLTAWQEGLFVDCAGSPEEMPDGSFKYWARSIFPVDSEIKTGQLVCDSTTRTGDPRNNPFTALTIGGVVQSLPHFPYTMPTHAALLQTDLRAAGWAGATVVATSATDWAIAIPNVYYNGYQTTSFLSWPVYYVANIYGDIVNPVAGRGFSGEYVNEAGVRTAVPKQFARLAVTRGPRVLP